MRNVETIAQAFYEKASTVSEIAKVELTTNFTADDLQRVRRTPLLLISPHTMFLTYGRHRQRGNQLLFDTLLISRQQRLERDEQAALEYIGVLDALDSAIINQNFDLAIQPFDVYHRKIEVVEKGISVVRTIYYTVVYDELAYCRFTYLDDEENEIAIDFNLISTSFQEEKIIDNNDYARTINGDMRAYAQPAKSKYSLRFTLISAALKDQLLDMKNDGTEITFYRDKYTSATMTCLWTNDFDFFEERPGFWTGSMVLNEV
jgi:hypothetical protein